MVLSVYHVVNTQQGVAREKSSSSIDSATYVAFLSKLFVASVLGTTLHTAELIFL